MFNFFKKKIILDTVKDFENQYKIAQIIILKYLKIWFKQIFTTPEWTEIFADKPDVHIPMAAEVMRYLLALDDTQSPEELQNNEKTIMAKKYSVKWSDDAMNKDNDFCDFIIQTLRMDSVFNQYFNGVDWWSKDPRGKKVSEIMMKYGSKVPESSDPKNYEKLLEKWMLWDKMIDEKNALLHTHCMPECKLGKYLHYKGSMVEVLSIALHSETLEEMVVYNHPDPVKGKEANTLWVRLKKMFMEHVMIDGKEIPRFTYTG